jgi:hypothetical protein
MGVLCLVTWCVAISDRHATPRHATARRLYKSFGVKGLKENFTYTHKPVTVLCVRKFVPGSAVAILTEQLYVVHIC